MTDSARSLDLVNLDASDIATIADSLPSLLDEALPLLWGLLRSRNSREKAAILGMAKGEGRRSAAIRLGISPIELYNLMNEDPDLREAIEFAEAIAIAQPEGELRRRALAGNDDRGSMRALEIYLKRHDPAYRDAPSTQITLVNEASRAQASVQSRWVPTASDSA